MENVCYIYIARKFHSFLILTQYSKHIYILHKEKINSNFKVIPGVKYWNLWGLMDLFFYLLNKTCPLR